MKVETVSEFRPLDLGGTSKPSIPPSSATHRQFSNTRRSRHERSGSSSGERQIEKKKSEHIIGTPEKDQDLTLQNYIK
jgi:hypothetical protein